MRQCLPRAPILALMTGDQVADGRSNRPSMPWPNPFARVDWGSGTALVCLAINIAIVLWGAGRGFNTPPEDAYYLLVDSDPFGYPHSLSAFGFIWHPLYLIAGADIAAFRFTGIVVTLSCAAYFGFALARLMDARGVKRLGIVAALCAAVFWFLIRWHITPNYNELSLAALLLVTGGLMAITPPVSQTAHARDGVANRVVAIVAAGVALAVLAVVKQTTGLMALAIGVLWLGVLRPPRWAWSMALAAAICLATLYLLVLATDGSVANYVARMRVAMAAVQRLGGTHDPYGLYDSIAKVFVVSRTWKVVATALNLLAGFGLLYWATRSFARTGSRWPLRLAIALLFSVFAAGLLAARFPVSHAWAAMAGYYAAYFLIPVFAGALLWSLWPHQVRQRDWRVLAVAALLSATPFAYSFGTHAALMLHMAMVAVFWAGSLILLVGVVEERAFLLACAEALCGLTSVVFTVGAAWVPAAGAAPLWQQTSPIAVGTSNATLLVSEADATRWQTLRQTAASHGFRPGQPLIDLSEQGPGIVLALGGWAPGEPWLFADVNGRLEYVPQVLETAPRPVLHNAWIVSGARRPTSELGGLLTKIGLDFPTDYARAGPTIPVQGNSLTLWKPQRGRGRQER